MRGEVLTLRERDFVWAARVMGRSRPPGLQAPDPQLALGRDRQRDLPGRRLDPRAGIPWLPGFGLQYPAASWGDMLGSADTYVSYGQWWLVYPVGFCLVAVVMACNLVGDALRDAFDVRLRRRWRCRRDRTAHVWRVSRGAARGDRPQHSHQADPLDRPGGRAMST